MNDQKEWHPAKGAQTSRRLNWIFGLLFIVAGLFAFHFATRNGVLENERTRLSQNLSNLDEQKSALEVELITLDESYQGQIKENDNLSATLEGRLAEVEKLKGRVWSAKKKLNESEKENKAINDRLIQLEELKQSLESDIASLKETNQDLSDMNTKIESDLQAFQEETVVLNAQLEQVSLQNEALIRRLQTIAPAGFVANNFKVTAAKKNDKLTIRARQAEHIEVAFDINDVPTEYHDEEEIYLVLTSFDGNPIDEVQSKSIEVASIEPISINVVDRTQTVLKERQNLQMKFDVDRDLESGLYNLLVYADHGFLGATTFELR